MWRPREKKVVTAMVSPSEHWGFVEGEVGEATAVSVVTKRNCNTDRNIV